MSSHDNNLNINNFDEITKDEDVFSFLKEASIIRINCMLCRKLIEFSKNANTYKKENKFTEFNQLYKTYLNFSLFIEHNSDKFKFKKMDETLLYNYKNLTEITNIIFLQYYDYHTEISNLISNIYEDIISNNINTKSKLDKIKEFIETFNKKIQEIKDRN